MQDLSAELLLSAYAQGVFPMSEGRDDPALFWVDPKMRGVLPLDGFRISRSLAKTLRRGHFKISFNTAFTKVVQGCADRDETWINGTIFDLYATLHARGDAHSVEVWEDRRLVGGAYGVALGAAFFGESMFSQATDASKVALAYLVDRLHIGGFTLCDTQFITDHLASLGAIEVTRATYHMLLADALKRPASFNLSGDAVPSAQDVIQRNAQTS
ncbi:leucyl/phenylalanyl-tRNA--protein transferase [Loktanella sp. D2R18]|uniref:leucyl/phenylalanyl-tRNA--protein transferase n=1 Tax=Rhodobacterales TaxID=204455 RepID=UPI000DEB0973|nr:MULTISPECIES: leucyl/phenylalanyl-tRNA--protein transferase [Rhodobacterales]MDO6590292.1 leucyl/phenylalanyl-tRNA--protein transferase [Yoonia sp. 1_MG-2023]RBW42903.1 leucyl/phenylalanyl-tRNA--protein transferase [Loktanella sp. D2R18]